MTHALSPDHRHTRPLPAWRRLALCLLATSALLLGGCAAMQAQNPNSPLAPVRASAIGSDAHVMLDGHDVVAYFTQNRHAMGQPDANHN